MKKIKMVIYGEPGVGKSVFASRAPKPFFITTDGNYEWLEDFGANPKDHIQVSSWSEAKSAFAMNFDKYETIVVDLLEDLFKWCEYEFCQRNKLEHVADLGYGKGYDISRNEFFIEICKLIGMDKNIIFIMHGVSFAVKDRRGVEHIKHAPSTRLPDKVVDMIEGRVRYFLRCYLQDEEQEDGTLIKRRWLSLVPKPNEFGIIRGVNENSIPHDIPLDYNIFAQTLGLNILVDTTQTVEEVETKVEKKVETEEKVEAKEKDEEAQTPPWEESSGQITIEETIAKTTETQPLAEKKTEVKAETTKEVSNEDKLAAIRAKLAALNSNK